MNQPLETFHETLAETASAPAVSADVVSVEIYDQVYHLRGVDPAYIEYLASMIDEKMRAVAARGGTVDSLRVAVLAALNIADELSTLRQRYDNLLGAQQDSQSTLRSRADSLAGMLDEVLGERRAGINGSCLPFRPSSEKMEPSSISLRS